MEIFKFRIQNKNKKIPWRFGLYLLIVIGSLSYIGHWYRQELNKGNDGKNQTFPVIAAQLNHQDGVLTHTWRTTWNLLPKSFQSKISSLSPPDPAINIRRRACSAIAHFGNQAAPHLLTKVTDSDDVIAQSAMYGLLSIGYSDDHTWKELNKMLFDSTRSNATRRAALIALVGLHEMEEKCIKALKKLAESKDPFLDTLAPKTIYTIAKGRIGIKPGMMKEQLALDQVKERLTSSFLNSLVVNDGSPSAKIAYYFASPSSYSIFREGISSLAYFKNRLLNRDRKPHIEILTQHMKGQLILQKNNQDLFLSMANHTSSKLKSLAVFYYSPDFERTQQVIKALIALTEHSDPEVQYVSLVYLNWIETFSAEVLPSIPQNHLISLTKHNDSDVAALATMLVEKINLSLPDQQKAP